MKIRIYKTLCNAVFKSNNVEKTVMDSLAIPNQNNIVAKAGNIANETHVKEIQGLCYVRKTLSALWLLDGAISHTKNENSRDVNLLYVITCVLSVAQ